MAMPPKITTTKNVGMKAELENDEPQITGALGAALVAQGM